MADSRRWSRALALLIGIQLLWFELAVLSGGRFSHAPGGRALPAIIAVVIYGLAIVALVNRSHSRRRFWIAAGAVVGSLGLTAAFYAPTIGIRRTIQANQWPATLSRDLPIIASLREIAAAQDQYRLAHGAYAGSADSLRQWTTVPPQASLHLDSHGAAGWSASESLNGGTCVIWARDSTLRLSARAADGAPSCENDDWRGVVPTLPGGDAAEVGFRSQDVTGTWTEHRADMSRTGIVGSQTDRNGYSWTARVKGELRSSVAVAGNQVFVGAHGNGEFVALHLDSGALGYRLRAPNWIHHEPVVTPDLVIVGFGNSELSGTRDVTGSAPSGVVAYDRATGRERWRRYTNGSVMTTPVLFGSIVATVTGGGDAVAWRATDGEELWKLQLPGHAPMSNPLVSDSLMVVSREPRSLCAIDIPRGRLMYCKTVAGRGWGAGHASVAVGDHVAFLVFDDGLASVDPTPTDTEVGLKQWWSRTLAMFGRKAPRELVMVALDIRDAKELWRISLGKGDLDVVGHIAGTPTVVGNIVYVPSPINGVVDAVRADSGRRLWSAPVMSVRGSVLVTHGAVLLATRGAGFVVLDATTGRTRCRQQLPGESDRAGPTLAGNTAILTLRNGIVMARPLAAWLACRA